MKKSIVLLSSFLLLIGFAQAAHSATVYFDFNGDTLADTAYGITAGDLFPADVYVAGADASPLGAFAVGVTFNPLLATATAATADLAWFPVPHLPAAGSASLEGTNMAGLATVPSRRLGTLDFTSLGAGIFDLQLGFLYQNGLDFVGPNLQLYDSLITFQNAQITAATAPVPLPGAFWLLGTGLIGLLGLRKRSANADVC